MCHVHLPSRRALACVRCCVQLRIMCAPFNWIFNILLAFNSNYIYFFTKRIFLMITQSWTRARREEVELRVIEKILSRLWLWECTWYRIPSWIPSRFQIMWDMFAQLKTSDWLWVREWSDSKAKRAVRWKIDNVFTFFLQKKKVTPFFLPFSLRAAAARCKQKEKRKSLFHCCKQWINLCTLTHAPASARALLASIQSSSLLPYYAREAR